LSQSANPVLHEDIVHEPAVQLGCALAKEQTLLHAPQLFTSVCVSIHSPLQAV
jgi:hypothetical protein